MVAVSEGEEGAEEHGRDGKPAVGWETVHSLDSPHQATEVDGVGGGVWEPVF